MIYCLLSRAKRKNIKNRCALEILGHNNINLIDIIIKRTKTTKLQHKQREIYEVGNMDKNCRRPVLLAVDSYNHVKISIILWWA